MAHIATAHTPAVSMAGPMTRHSPRAAPLKNALRRRVGISIGFAAGVVLLVASPFVGAMIDEQLHRGEDLAGLAGLVVGLMVGGALLVIAAPAPCMTRFRSLGGGGVAGEA